MALNNDNLEYNESGRRVDNFKAILGNAVVDIETLKELSWKGIPNSMTYISLELRPLAWKLLLGYCPTNSESRAFVLTKKREDYFSMVDAYIEHPTLEKDAQERKIYKLIRDDVIRTLPESQLFRHSAIQTMLQR